MKKNMRKFKIAETDAAGVEIFQDFILDNVYVQIAQLPDLKEESIIVIGAETDGKPVGAAVAQLFEDYEIYIHSIMVADEYRRQGVGTELLKEVLNVCLMAYDPAFVFNTLHDEFFVHLEYALPEPEKTDFEAFLKAFGFARFYDFPALYIFRSGQLAGLGRKCSGVTAVVETEGADPELVADFFEETGLYPDPELCFFTGTEDEPRCVMMAQPLGDGTYQISGVNTDEESSREQDLQDLFFHMIYAIEQKNDSFVLLVNEMQNQEEDFWKRISETHGETIPHREAALLVSFE